MLRGSASSTVSTVSNLQTYTILLCYYYYYKTIERERGRQDTVDTVDKGVYRTSTKKKKTKKIKGKSRLHRPVVFCLVQRVHRVQPLLYYYYYKKVI